MTESAQKACPMCGESILAVAIKCKHCGSVLNQPPPLTTEPAQIAAASPAKKSSAIVRWGGGVIAAIFALAFCGKLMGGDQKSSTPQAPQAQAASAPAAAVPASTSVPAAHAIAVSNNALWKEYNANEVAADNKYKGKTLEVTGKVGSIDKDLMDNIVVHLVSPNRFMSTLATMQKSQGGRAAELAKGQRVTVVCEGGGRVLGSPVLRDCVLR